MRPRVVLAALVSLALVTAGCAGTPAGEPTDGSTVTPTQTPTDEHTATPTGDSDGSATATPAGPPTGTVDFPDGPKSAPARPSTLNESSVREYVRTHEYRYAYNSLWMSEYTEVTLDCRVDDVTQRGWGYEAVVTCTGYSNTDVPENSTATAGPHADWFTQSFRYRVSDGATERVRVENRDPV